MRVRDKAGDERLLEYALANAYMRWALQAVEQVAGRDDLAIILREAGLEHLLGNFPPNDMSFSVGLTFRDYAALNQAIVNYFGPKASEFTLRIGRVSAERSVSDQSAVFGLTGLALRLLPTNLQIKMVLNNMVSTFRRLAAKAGDSLDVRIEEREDRWIYRGPDCSTCAGKEADSAICWVFVGAIQQALSWATGKEFEVVETACRATGAPECVFEINKTPKER
jgi:predicted hydrocarbon binding protein